MRTERSGRSPRLWLGIAFALLFAMNTNPARGQYGLALSGVGPINRSMGGASTAAPLDAAGALYWNPATITGLPNNEMEFGLGIFVPRTTLRSSIPAGALGNGYPTVNSSGNTGANNGTFLLPSFGLVYTPEGSPFTYGFGVYEIGGFGVNYPASTTNPILNPQVPFGRGVGPFFTQLQMFQFAPSIAMKVTDSLSIGASANIDSGSLMVSPALFTPAALAQTPLGPGPAYPAATNGRYHAGAGFQVGVYWEATEAWSFGASYKSTQWMEPYTYNVTNPVTGAPQTAKFHLDFPQFVSIGTAYKGIDKLLVALDLKYADYRDTAGFQGGGFNQRGALNGLGWQSVFGLGLGAQYLLTDDLSVRAGYTFALNPVGNAVTIYNIGSPTIIQHSLALGASYNVTQKFKLSLTWAHDFQNSVEGPIVLPFFGKVPGSHVRSTATADTVLLGATVSF